MQKQLLTNLFLLLLVIGLSLFLFINDSDQNTIKKLTPVSINDINNIVITHNQRETILNKINQHWTITKPVDISANQIRIKTLLSMLNTNSHSQYATESLELKKYGLNNSKTAIRFNNIKINFGTSNPINNYRYVKIDGQLHLIDDNFYPLVSSQIGALVARELIHEDAKVTKLILPEHILFRDENKLWKTEQDISSDAIIETIDHWKHKQAFAVHDYVERKSLGKIQAYFENTENPVDFYITDSEPWLIIARPDLNLEYHFNIEDYDALLRPGTKQQLPQEFEDGATTEEQNVSPDEFMDAIQVN